MNGHFFSAGFFGKIQHSKYINSLKLIHMLNSVQIKILTEFVNNLKVLV